MVKRQLSDSEKKICGKMVDKMEKEIRHLKFLERYYDLMVGEGLYWNYLEKVEQEKGKKREILGDMQDVTMKIVELKKQMLEGVEEKVPPGVG